MIVNNYRKRPKGNYMQQAAWQDLYILTESWKNDLEYYLFEAGFLERLVETYFVKLLLQENIDELKELQRDLFETKIQCKNMLLRTREHLSYIIYIIGEPYKYEASVFRHEHEQFEDEISDFILMLEVVRLTVFNMIKEVLDNEKPKFIWKYN